MSNVYLITDRQVHAARLVLQAVAAFVEVYTPDDISNPDYARTRAQALEMLNDLSEGWQHLPTISRIGQG